MAGHISLRWNVPAMSVIPSGGKNLLAERMAKFFSTFKLVAASINVPCSVSPTSNPLLADALQRAQVGRDHNIEKKL